MIDEAAFRRSFQDREAETSGITLVAFYKDTKPSALQDLIAITQGGLRQCLADYPKLLHLYRHWAHATLCGMEGHMDSIGNIFTGNMLERAGNTSEPVHTLEIDGFLDFVRSYSWPMCFQFGGYHPDDINPYDRSRKPWDRSFTVRSDALMVLMGWPLSASRQPFSPQLYEFRQTLHRFGVVHKYHCHREDRDNDLFMVTAGLNYDEWRRLPLQDQHHIRDQLTGFQNNHRVFLQSVRYVIDLSLDQIWLVKYRRTTLLEVEFSKKLCEVCRDDFADLYSSKDST